MRPCGCKGENVCVHGEKCMTRTQEIHAKRKCMHQMNARNPMAKGTRPLHHPLHETLHKVHAPAFIPPPRPPPMQSVHCCKSKESAWAHSRRRRHGRGRCWDLGEGKLGCSRGREPGPEGRARPASAQGPGAPTFRMRRLRRASAANTRSPTAESSMLTRRFPPWPLPGAEKQQPAHDRP